MFVLEGELVLVEDDGETLFLTTLSDVDMKSSNVDGHFVHKDGTPY